MFLLFLLGGGLLFAGGAALLDDESGCGAMPRSTFAPANGLGNVVLVFVGAGFGAARCARAVVA